MDPGNARLPTDRSQPNQPIANRSPACKRPVSERRRHFRPQLRQPLLRTPHIDSGLRPRIQSSASAIYSRSRFRSRAVVSCSHFRPRLRTPHIGSGLRPRLHSPTSDHGPHFRSISTPVLFPDQSQDRHWPPFPSTTVGFRYRPCSISGHARPPFRNPGCVGKTEKPLLKRCTLPVPDRQNTFMPAKAAAARKE